MTPRAPLTACLALLLLGAATAASTGRLRMREAPDGRLDESVRQHNAEAFEHETKVWCDEVLGCLNITEEWYTDIRPVNRLPETREEIDTKFFLQTREEIAADEEVTIVAGDDSTVQQSTFSPSRETKLILHGFTDHGSNFWVKAMAQELLNYGDYNVIRVCWKRGAAALYSQAVANARVVGLEVGYLINWLADEYGLDRGTLHLIGHSLGAHISGYAGEQIKGMGRISGLDPAGPEFTNTPTFVRLDPTDAVFVDTMHTNGDPLYKLGAGTSQPMGHLDFFPNGGLDQPGCGIVDSGFDFLSCSHCRSYDLYRETIGSSCNFLSYECSSYEEYMKGSCDSCGEDSSHCAFMGFHADKYADKSSRANVLLYSNTDEQEPFCTNHYEVVVTTANPEEAEEWVMGHLFGTFYGDNGKVIERVQITDEHLEIYHGEKTKFIFNHPEDVGKVIRADLEWRYDAEVLHPGTNCVWPLCNRNLYVSNVLISPMNYYPESNRLEYTVSLCSVDGGIELEEGKTVSFAMC